MVEPAGNRKVRVNLQRGIAARSGEFLLFAVTPPRLTTSPREAAEIGRITLQRLRPLAIDGLVLYDIDDESDRNPDERPFQPAIVMVDMQLEHATRAALPSLQFPGEQGWYFNQGEKYGVEPDWFTVPALVEGGH